MARHNRSVALKYIIRLILFALAAGYFLLRPYTLKNLLATITVITIVAISQYILYRMDRSPQYCARPESGGEKDGL